MNQCRKLHLGFNRFSEGNTLPFSRIELLSMVLLCSLRWLALFVCVGSPDRMVVILCRLLIFDDLSFVSSVCTIVYRDF